MAGSRQLHQAPLSTRLNVSVPIDMVRKEPGTKLVNKILKDLGLK
jgi:hypothetical protein